MTEKRKALPLVQHGDKCKCGARARKGHVCPYKEELYDDQTLCNCCTKCMQECAADI